MADDQNISNRRPMNTSSDAIDESHLLTELERIGARASRPTASRAQLEQRISGEGKLLNKLYEEAERTPSIRGTPFFMQHESSLRESIRGIRTKMNSMETAHIARAESEASTLITNQFSSSAINAQVSTYQGSAAVQNRAFSMSGRSFDELQARREDLLASVRVSERGALNEVRGMFGRTGQVDPERSAALGAMMSGTQDKFREMAMINAAMQIQKVQETDPLSKLRRTTEMGQDASKLLSAEGIAKELQQGGVNISHGGRSRHIAGGDINREIIEQSRALVNALKELSDGVEKTDEKLGELRKAADESANNLDKLKQAQSMGGGGGASYSQWAAAAAGGFNAAGGAIEQIFVGQRLGQMANTAGFAGIENQKYGMYQSARGGDIMSQLLLSQWDGAEGFGKELFAGQQAANAAYLAGGVAQTTAGVLQMNEAGLQKGNIFAYLTGASTENTAALLAGAQNTAQGLATTAATGIGTIRRVSANAAQIQGTQLDIETQKALLGVSASQLQGFRDFSVGMGAVAQNLGGAGGGFLQQNVSNGMMDRMIGARLSPEQLVNMSQFGAQSMGSMFDINQVFAARGAERSGYGSMQENMQRMATLANAGSNNPQAGLASVLEVAVSKGLDTSRAIGLVAEHTAAMVQTSMGRAAGLDTTTATAQILGASVNQSDPNKEFAVNRAAAARDVMRGIGMDTGVNFAAMAATARLQKSTGVSGEEAILLQKMSDEDLRSLQGFTSKEQIEKFFTSKGIRVPGDMSPFDLVNKTIDARLRTNLQAGSSGLATGVDVEGILAAFKSHKGFEQLSKDQQLQLGRAAGFAGLSTGEELFKHATAVASKEPNQLTKDATSKILAGEGGSDVLKVLDILRTSGFKQISEAAKDATVQLKGVENTLKALSALNANFEQFGGAGGESKFATAAADSAGTFGESTILFESSVKEFSDAVKILNIKAGLGADVSGADKAKYMKLLEQANRAQDQKAGRGQTK